MEMTIGNRGEGSKNGIMSPFKRMKIVVVTYIPSPYQVELFNAVAGTGAVDLHVIYLFSKPPVRGCDVSPVAASWEAPEIRHPHVTLDDGEKVFSSAMEAMDAADLVVLGYYRHPVAGRLIRHRAYSGKKWVFWGERPGYRLQGRVGDWLGRWQQGPLYKSAAPIWGMGEWAVEGYRERFGWNRRYFNVPYFSDLSRLGRIGIRKNPGEERTFLFSGSLIRRKGADLLVSAFRKLASRYPGVRLRIVGNGPLRRTIERELSLLGERVDLRGFRPYRELTENYCGAHVLCVPSRYDGWGMVVPEGLAAALPVISTDHTGAARELVRKEVNGWVVSAGNEGALYSAMRQATELPDETLWKYSVNARTSVLQHSLEKGVERFILAAEGSMGASTKGAE